MHRLFPLAEAPRASRRAVRGARLDPNDLPMWPTPQAMMSEMAADRGRRQKET